MAIPRVGDRVILTADVDNFPTVLVSKGNTGVVSGADDVCLMVRLDTTFDDLDEWDNQLQIFFEHFVHDGLPIEVVRAG